MEEKNEDNEENSDDSLNNQNEDTEISASFASLDLTVRTQGKDECKELFDDVWDKMLEDAESMDESVRNRLSGFEE